MCFIIPFPLNNLLCNKILIFITHKILFIHKWVGKLDIQREKIWDPRDHRIISNLAH